MNETATMTVSTLRRVFALVAVLGSALLVASLFLDWFSLAVKGEERGVLESNGWSAFEFSDAAFVLLLFAALWAAFAPAARRPGGPRLLYLGVSAAAIVAIAVLTTTPVQELFEQPQLGNASVSLEGGAYLGIGGGLLMLIAGLLDEFLAGGRSVTASRAGQH